MSDKREIQRRNRELAQKKAVFASSVKWIIIAVAGIAIIGLIAWAVASSVVSKTNLVSDYSKGLNEDGTIENVKALDYVELFDYKNLSVSRSELEPSDEEVMAYIDTILEQFPAVNDDESIVIKEGDTINLDYVGSVDGVEFQGGSTGGQGTSLTIGSGMYIPGFEEQIVGHHVGENFDIEVTFPEQYKEELAGKDAVFNITINGVNEKAKFTDEFVSIHLAQYAVTTDGFIKFYKDAVFEQRLTEYVSKHIIEDTKVTGYPKNYLKIVKGQLAYDDQMNYQSAGNEGSVVAASGMTQKEYDAQNTIQAQNQLETKLKVQAIYEDAELTVTSDDVTKFFESSGLGSQYYASYEATYGKPYIYNASMAYTVVEYIKANIIIVD